MNRRAAKPDRSSRDAMQASVLQWRDVMAWLRAPHVPHLPWLSWALPGVFLVCAVVAVPVMVANDRGLPRYRMLKTQLGNLQQQNEGLARSVRTLQEEVHALGHDPNAIERAARDLGMIEDGEVTVYFTAQ